MAEQKNPNFPIWKAKTPNREMKPNYLALGRQSEEKRTPVFFIKEQDFSYETPEQKASRFLFHSKEEDKHDAEENLELDQIFCQKGYPLADGRLRERELVVRKALLDPNPELEKLVPKARNITEEFWETIRINGMAEEERRGTSADWRTPYSIQVTPQNLKAQLNAQPFKLE